MTDTAAPGSVAQALAMARALGLERLDAQLLLAQALQRPRAWLLAHDDDAVPTAAAQAYIAACRLRADDVPLAYLLGEREFHGLRLAITPAVLVPRPDTETLVDWALELLVTDLVSHPAPRVADLGTGSGAIALALKHRHAAAQVYAVDFDDAALDVARANAQRLGLAVEFKAGDWLRPLAGQRFHLLVSNPPYIAADDPHLPALHHEPLQALTPGGDGLAAIEQIARDAPGHLLPGGWLLLEHGNEQAAAVRHLLTQAAFAAVHTRMDLAGRPRCSGGRMTAD